MHLPADRVFAPTERPDVKVMVKGRWVPGELRGWHAVERSSVVTWLGSVQYRLPGASQSVIEDFEKNEVRLL